MMILRIVYERGLIWIEVPQVLFLRVEFLCRSVKRIQRVLRDRISNGLTVRESESCESGVCIG